MVELTNTLTFLLIANSLITTILILNQNDSAKDSLAVKNSSTPTNPLENFTWICLVIQLSLLLIKTKVTDF